LGLILEKLDNGKIIGRDPATLTALVKGCYGILVRGKVELYPEEALYLMDIRNAKCYDSRGNILGFNEIAINYTGLGKFMSKYLSYKAWRDRGLMLRPGKELKQTYNRNKTIKYPISQIKLDKYAMKGLFFDSDLVTIIDDSTVANELYNLYWIGQFGTYKAEQRGNLGKLSIFETLFLLKHSNLKLINSTITKVKKVGREHHQYFDMMYDVYEDWRLKGYILKTGFKFGTHFRLYYPGAGPKCKGKEWIHSKHVVHVFPKKCTLLTSELSRVIRVAHSVRKTFILAIPGINSNRKPSVKIKTNLDYIAYHRHKKDIVRPAEGDPKYLMFSISEEEYINGKDLSKAKACDSKTISRKENSCQ